MSSDPVEAFCGTVHSPGVVPLLESVSAATFKCSAESLVKIPTTATGVVPLLGTAGQWENGDASLMCPPPPPPPHPTPPCRPPPPGRDPPPPYSIPPACPYEPSRRGTGHPEQRQGVRGSRVPPHNTQGAPRLRPTGNPRPRPSLLKSLCDSTHPRPLSSRPLRCPRSRAGLRHVRVSGVH
jgi:hypothetical protein